MNSGVTSLERPWLIATFFAVALTLGLFGVLPFVSSFLPWTPPSYFYPYFQIDYFDFGFVRRGLVGTLARFMGVGASDTAVVIGFAISVVLSTIIITAFAAWATRRLPATQRILVMAALLLSPATFMHWGCDPGRFDMLTFAAIVLAFWAIATRKILLATAMLAIAALIHEAALILAGPALAAIGLDAFTEQQRSRTLRLRLALGAVVLTALFLLLLKSSVAMEDLAGIPGVAAGPQPIPITDPYYAWVTPLEEAARFSICAQTSGLLPIISVSALLLFAVLHILALFAGQKPTRQLGAWLTLAAPVAMWAITIDHGRYFSWAVATLLIYRLTLMASDKAQTIQINRIPMIGIWAMTLLGPIGIVSGFKIVTLLSRLVGAQDVGDLFEACALQ